MQTVDEFMQDYFAARLADHQLELARRAPFWHKFHTPDCLWDSRAGTSEMMQSEQVDIITVSGDTAEVITTRNTFRQHLQHGLRYHLTSTGSRWQIQSVDLWCSACRGNAGNNQCIFCHGTGWLNPHRDRGTPPPPKNPTYRTP